MDGCTRAITKVGDVTAPRTPRAAPMPWVSVVFPAPRSPVRISRSPASSRVPRCSPNARVSSAVSSRCVIGSIRSMVRRFPLRSDSTYPRLRQKLIVPGSSTRASSSSPLNPSSWAISRAREAIWAATPRPRTGASTPTRRSPSSRPRGSNIRAPTGAPSCWTSRPPCAESASRTDSRVSSSAVAGGSSGGRFANASCTTARTSAARLPSTVSTVMSSLMSRQRPRGPPALRSPGPAPRR